MPPPEYGDGMRGIGAEVPESDGNLELLRRRVYAPGASEQDRIRYAAAMAAREASAASRDGPPTGEPPAVLGEPQRPWTRTGRRGRVRLLVASGAVVAAVSVSVAVGLGAVRAPEPLPTAARGTVAPPVVLTATAFADDPGSARVLDQAFAKPGSASAKAAAGFLAGVARTRSDPSWASRAMLLDDGGIAARGVVSESETRGVLLRRGSRVTLSVLTPVPAAVEWRILGYRSGERRAPHEVLVVRTAPFTESRAVFASLVVPADMTVTSFRIAVSPRGPLVYDYLVEPPR